MEKGRVRHESVNVLHRLYDRARRQRFTPLARADERMR
jgi:hypothetical protein